MKFYVGLWDLFFGEKVTLEVPGDDGDIIKRVVTKKWLEKMQSESKATRVSTVTVHILDTTGYSIEEWGIGTDVNAATVDKFRDPGTGNLYALSFYEGGKPKTIVLTKAQWEEAKGQLSSL